MKARTLGVALAGLLALPAPASALTMHRAEDATFGFALDQVFSALPNLDRGDWLETAWPERRDCRRLSANHVQCDYTIWGRGWSRRGTADVCLVARHVRVHERRLLRVAFP